MLDNANTELDLDTWSRDGLLVVDDVLSATELEQLQQWVLELENRPGTTDQLLQYNETTVDGSIRRCRTENFLPYHDGLRALLTVGRIPEIAGTLLGQKAVLYKEKINYKAPGGSGFAAHQDAPAYPYVSNTIACMIAVDDSTLDNGCLEVARRKHAAQLPTDTRGCVEPAVAQTLEWEPLPVAAGSLVFFHCYVPHRSGPNSSDSTRRAIYLTYNGESDGRLRESYYAKRIHDLADHPDQLSLIGHFAGAAKPAASSSDEEQS
ncbi:phytanoyl-CoA dioxygenase family protein [Dietzia sp. DQ12-45-1b]|uniref:phytanoyl-CoA dioxygenase family protein n=1 Tax=Dietzia sp. DQ12-45-1b TaxID=912801 RepID=UPI0012E76D91|nr:phytanoyl-CoA dioxygenase family protein [Dietzia sp. DQ12-45-1b]